jgi:hypothetical protein
MDPSRGARQRMCSSGEHRAFSTRSVQRKPGKPRRPRARYSDSARNSGSPRCCSCLPVPPLSHRRSYLPGLRGAGLAAGVTVGAFARPGHAWKPSGRGTASCPVHPGIGDRGLHGRVAIAGRRTTQRPRSRILRWGSRRCWHRGCRPDRQPSPREATRRVAQALNISVLAGPFLLAAGVTLLLAGLVAALAPGDSLGLLTLALALLGLGWNFGLISGTALIVDATPLETRARTQGTVDVLIASAGGCTDRIGRRIRRCSFGLDSCNVQLRRLVRGRRTACAHPDP